MQDVNEYWTSKEQKSELAKYHTKKMEELYKDEIDNCIMNTVFYDRRDCEEVVPEKRYDIYSLSLVDEDTVSCLLEQKDKSDVTVLNFSSYKHPCGGFIAGSNAQEECLCHESYLYNVIRSFKPVFYDWNENHKNKALYLNRALFSPNVRFERDDDVNYVNVITCAAPNYSTASKYCNVSKDENTEALKSRIKYVLDIAYKEGTKVLILGAYGCGVFKQDPYEVAKIFMDYISTEYASCFEDIIFAIPKTKNGNYEAFAEVIKSYIDN